MTTSPKFDGHSVLDQMLVPVLIKRRSGEFIYVNDAFCRMLETSRAHLFSGHYDEISKRFIAVKSTKLDDKAWAEGINTQPLQFVTEFVSASGKQQIMSVQKKAMHLSNGDEAVMTTLTDITDFASYEKELEMKHRELREQQIKLKELASLDPLTGINNRRSFYDRADELLTYAKVGNLEVGVLMFDLDRFKQLNDTYGHATGDEALVQFTKLLKSKIRGSDTLARIGGEEFALLLPDNNRQLVMQVAERIRKWVEENSFTSDGVVIRFTTSIGGTMWNPAEDSIDPAMRRADDALYAAKAKGRNRFCFWDELDQTHNSEVA